jgi:hypothetical protein
VPSLAGIRLPNRIIRRGVFKTLHAVGVKIAFTMPANMNINPGGTAIANYTNFLNFERTISDLGPGARLMIETK